MACDTASPVKGLATWLGRRLRAFGCRLFIVGVRVLPTMPNEQLLLAIEIEIAVLVESFFEELPSKKKRRALLKRLKRNTRKHVKDRSKLGEDGQAAAEIAAVRLKAHAKALRVIGD